MKSKFAFIYVASAILIFAACSRSDYESYTGNRNYGTAVGGYDAYDMPQEAEVYYLSVSDSDSDGYYALEAPAMARATMSGGGAAVSWEEVAEQTQRQIIQTATIEMETEEFEEVVAGLRALTNEDGYIESEMLTTHRRKIFTIVMRVPAESFDEVRAQAEALATVRNTSQRAQDVSDQFHDLASNLETRRIEEERILALIDEARNVQDLLALETRLSNTRLSIETYLAQLNNMAGQIAFSTITVTLYDISETPVAAAPGFGERIGGAFGDSWNGTVKFVQNIIIFLAAAIVPLSFLALACLFAFVFFKVLFKIILRKNKVPI
ncbi:MAG: DUF4349 domain-containing protein [Clostridiales bacterium]|jgi:hypothetical protein|nr:DUF4349 domain-containing protein [Clostridiales bacterium]